ncbi:MAG: tyrosine-type recombinase/integrase [Rhizomicrobium sp.]
MPRRYSNRRDELTGITVLLGHNAKWARLRYIPLIPHNGARNPLRIGEQLILERRVREQNVFCSRRLFFVNRSRTQYFSARGLVPFMSGSLFDRDGIRKYLVAHERLASARQTRAEGHDVGTFCLTLAPTGARISEVLALTADRIDAGNASIVFETLKQRKRGMFRAVPAPRQLLDLITNTTASQRTVTKADRLWPWGRTTAWKHVKRIMKDAGIPDALSKPKALRHGFAIEAGQRGVPLNIVQRWLGHARLETTAIYAGALGEEERNLATRLWQGLGSVLGSMD